MILNQPNMAVQEDLASLFAKNMTLSAAQPRAPTPPPPPHPDRDDNKIIYVSQHYTHSAHVTQHQHQHQQHQQQPQPGGPQDEPIRRPSSDPPRSDLHDLELLLRSHGVNTTALSPPQVELFRNAGDAQKMRLIQLWTICPPAGSADNPTLTWANTTVEQEEMLARGRLELQQLQQQQQNQRVWQAGPAPAMEVVMSLDGTETETTLGSSPAAPSMQSADGRWPAPAQHHVEPYMQSGYEELARREYEASARAAGRYKAATDPVYRAATGGVLDWDRQQWVESQYGSIVAWGDDEEML